MILRVLLLCGMFTIKHMIRHIASPVISFPKELYVTFFYIKRIYLFLKSVPFIITSLFERIPFNTQTYFGVTPCLVIREYGEALTHLFTKYSILLRSQNFCISLFDGLRCKTVHTMLLPWCKKSI